MGGGGWGGTPKYQILDTCENVVGGGSPSDRAEPIKKPIKGPFEAVICELNLYAKWGRFLVTVL